MQEAFVALSRNSDIWHTDLQHATEAICHACSRVLEVERVSVWLLDDAGSSLACKTLYLASQDNFTTSQPRHAANYPAYFRTIESERVIAANDVAEDSRLAEFIEIYIKPLGIGAVLDAAIRYQGEFIGFLCLEHVGGPRHWSSDAQNFAASVADLLSQLVMFHRLLESEIRYRKLFETIGDGVFILSDGIFMDCNAAAMKLFGAQPQDITGRTPAAFSPPFQPDGQASGPKVTNKIRSAEKGETQFFEWRYKTLHGKLFDADVTLSATELTGKTVIFGVVRDITERKKAEMHVRELNDYHQAIADAANYAIITIDTQGIIKSFNRMAEKLSGYSAQTLIGNQPMAVLHDSDEIIVRAAELSEEYQADIEPGLDVFIHKARLGSAEEHEWTYVSKTGTRIPVRLSITALHPGDAGISGYLIIAADISEQRQSQEELLRSKQALEHRAHHDSLTDLPNRGRLHEVATLAIQVAQMRNHELALMLLDLDRFKEVNDTLGHHVGDKLLKQLALRLQSLLSKQGAQLYRLGGDEFAILVPEISQPKDALRIGESISQSLRDPIALDGVTLELSGSIGIAYCPEHGDNSHDLLRCADVAMYNAKSRSSGVSLYEPELDRHSPKRLAMIGDLGTAIRENQMLLHFQPRVELDSGLCVGSEALLRWQHPVLGLIPPAEFIPLAEMGELIRPLTLWVLHTALVQIEDWRKKGIHLPVAINLSARNLLDTAFPKQVKQLIDRFQVPASLLEFEITESALISDPTRASQIIDRISNYGVRFALDDFGTGYSSLGHLKRLPVSVLKIDGSFVKDMLNSEEDNVIVQSTIDLGHRFGMRVVAEGVENHCVLESLLLSGCDEAQGFHLARPMPGDIFIRWLNNRNRPQQTLKGFEPHNRQL